MRFACEFWNEAQGQDLVEYSLLIAFVAVASAGLFASSGGSVASIWAKVHGRLSQADSGIN